MNQTEFINEYVNNNLNNSENGNVKIVDDIFYHFDTPIIEKYNGKFILNASNYSDVTRFLQKKIRNVIPKELIIEVNKVPINFKGSLKEYVNE